MKERFSLNGAWKLKGTDPYVPLRVKSAETGKELEGLTQWMEADVPGSVQLALYRAGYIEHPYHGMNSLKCEWVENRWWVYRKEFDKPALGGEKILLHFAGVDYECIVSLNGVELGRHEGMYEDFSFDVTPFMKNAQHFVLEVILMHAPDEMGQIGMTSRTHTQKSRFGYKWDFSTRLVHMGIWRDVELIAVDEASLADIFVKTDVDSAGQGIVRIMGCVEGGNADEMHVQVALKRKNQTCLTGLAQLRGRKFETKFTVENPRLWFPNGMGDQPLYDVQIMLLRGEKILDEQKRKIGIRGLRYLKNEGAPEDARPYTIEINGQRVYLKGVNITPLDHIYSDVPEEQVRYMLEKAAQMHVNIVRVWGGGVIESEYFYDVCDELGLLVWQEFIQSSSGLDNMPSEIPSFLELLRRSAICAVKEKRNHTALVIWSGGNELMDVNKTPVDESNPNIAMLQAIVHSMDPDRLFLPTSPSGPEAHISKKPDRSHDVHGWWQYQGNPGQYSYFGDTDSLLHSEFGCDGMSSMQTIVRALGEKPERPVKMHDSDRWRFHGDWWCTYDREARMFGLIDDMDVYQMASQWMQAEGLRYILESNQGRKWRNSGSIIWQLNEPWPNLSCTSLIDYDGHLKMAWYIAREAFEPMHVTLLYKKLDYRPGEVFRCPVRILAENVPEGEASVRVDVYSLNGELIEEKTFGIPVKAYAVNEGELFSFSVPEVEGGMFMIRLKAEIRGASSVNEYWFSTNAEHPYQAARLVHGAWVETTVLERGEGFAKIVVRNRGTVPVLHAHIIDKSDCFNIFANGSFHTLLKGEAWTTEVRWSKRFRYGFDEFACVNAKEPILHIRGIGLAEDRTI